MSGTWKNLEDLEIEPGAVPATLDGFDGGCLDRTNSVDHEGNWTSRYSKRQNSGRPDGSKKRAQVGGQMSGWMKSTHDEGRV